MYHEPWAFSLFLLHLLVPQPARAATCHSWCMLHRALQSSVLCLQQQQLLTQWHGMATCSCVAQHGVPGSVIWFHTGSLLTIHPTPAPAIAFLLRSHWGHECPGSAMVLPILLACILTAPTHRTGPCRPLLRSHWGHGCSGSGAAQRCQDSGRGGDGWDGAPALLQLRRHSAGRVSKWLGWGWGSRGVWGMYTVGMHTKWGI